MNMNIDPSMFGLKLRKLPAFASALSGKDRADMGHGTTIVALLYGNSKGVVVAADRRMSFGQSYSDDAKKISEIGKFALLACAGSVACIQDLEEALRVNIESSEQTLGVALDLNACGKILKNIMGFNLEGAFIKAVIGYIALPILAGFDWEKEGAFIFSYDALGAFFDESRVEAIRYDAIGCGSGDALPILKKSWRCDLDEKSAIDLAVEALFYAGSINAFTSQLPLSPPTIKYVDGKGIKSVSKKESREISLGIYVNFLKKEGKEEEAAVFSEVLSKLKLAPAPDEDGKLPEGQTR